MFPPEFVTECDNALYQIGVGAAYTQLCFGQQDFPEDGGAAFRNDLYKFPYFYFQALSSHYLHEQSTDIWRIRNREAVFTLTTEHLVRVVAASDFYVRARQFHLANVDPQNVHLRVVLDWLTSRIPGARRGSKAVD